MLLESDLARGALPQGTELHGFTPGAKEEFSLQLPCSKPSCLTSLTVHRERVVMSEEEGLRAKGLFFQAAMGQEQLDLVYIHHALQSQPSASFGVLPRTQQHLKDLPCQPQVMFMAPVRAAICTVSSLCRASLLFAYTTESRGQGLVG